MNINVSVIIPTFDRAKFISEAIHSVLNQTYQNFEIIVIDDGSTDGTREVVSALESEKLRYFYNTHEGISSALNTGIDNSKGRYIARLDSDDLFLPEKLELQVQVLDANPEIDLVYTQTYNIADDGEILCRYPENHESPTEPLRNLRSYLFVPSQSIMFRRDCIDKIGDYNEEFAVAEDWDFCIRMAQEYKFSYINQPLVKVRNHAGMITQDAIQKIKNTIAVLEKHRVSLSLGEGYGWMSPHYYRLGREYFYFENYELAQSAFQKALSLSSANYLSMFYYFLCCFPPILIAKLKNLRRMIGSKSL